MPHHVPPPGPVSWPRSYRMPKPPQEEINRAFTMAGCCLCLAFYGVFVLTHRPRNAVGDLPRLRGGMIDNVPLAPPPPALDRSADFTAVAGFSTR